MFTIENVGTPVTDRTTDWVYYKLFAADFSYDDDENNNNTPAKIHLTPGARFPIVLVYVGGLE